MANNIILKARYVTIFDEKLLLQWANDPLTRYNSFNSKQIDESTHHAWLLKQLENETGSEFYIIETEDLIPVGQVRFEKEKANWKIDYLVAPDFRGNGLGKEVLKCALMELKSNNKDCLVLGKVKRSNIASKKYLQLYILISPMKIMRY